MALNHRHSSTQPPANWQQGQLLELEIDDLGATGDGVGHWETDQRTVFVPNTVPGDRISTRLLHVKPSYARGKLQAILAPSPHRVRPACIVADKCGGCQWQAVAYDYQLTAKRNQVVQALQRVGKFAQPPVDPILAAPLPLAYRNKVTYPLRERQHNGQHQIQAGYYRRGSHTLINLNQCPVQDPRLDPLLAGIKQDIQTQGWSIYDEHQHQGHLRHLGLRIGRRTGEILLTLVTRDPNLPDLGPQAETWLQTYPGLVGITMNVNPDRTNRIFGDRTFTIAGQAYLLEEFAGLRFQIRPETFFQIYTEQAEALLNIILDHLNLTGHETIIDAYCGIGTLTLPLARQARHIWGWEIQYTAVDQARTNAELNHINNVTFRVGKIATLLSEQLEAPDVILLDPPRKGCTPTVLDQLIRLNCPRLVYMSCNPATLARDLDHLCHQGPYQLQRVQPADFFPQTAHVEAVAFLHTESPHHPAA